MRRRKAVKTFSLFQGGSGCSGSLLKWYLTRIIIAYRFNERGEISQYQKYWYRHIGEFYKKLSTLVDICGVCSCYALSTFVDTCACCVLCAVHFSGHLRVLSVMRCPLLWTLARVACYALSTFVDTCACCVLCAVHFSGHLRVLRVMCCPL